MSNLRTVNAAKATSAVGVDCHLKLLFHVCRPGAESVQAAQKLMSLTDRVRPHDSKKHPLPASASVPALPAALRPMSPFKHRRSPLPSNVVLSLDSSSVTGMLTL